MKHQTSKFVSIPSLDRTLPAVTEFSKLPIDSILPQLLESIHIHQNVLLHAPPGAGKTTRVPLALLDRFPPGTGRILMLEPRRIAVVSSARWMSQILGEDVGRTVGYSIRFESCVTKETRIEVVTEGILTRRIQSDPGLTGVAMIIFDEFHERSIHADLGLVLCREVQQLRSDLKLLFMSATLDLQPLSRLLDNAPVISSEGRCFPVEIKYIDDHSHGRVAQKVAAAVVRALHETVGDILAFLPGSGEIRSCAALLSETGIASHDVSVCQLYGDLPIVDQQKAIQAGATRKVVLATSIAETSLTIEGVRTVIDCGMSRRLQFDPGNGLNRLVTVRESRASAEQRAGRAGRVAAGVCYRLFSQHTLHAMVPYTPPEICITDLSQLVLELSAWGVDNPNQLGWLDAPPESALNSARSLLSELDLFNTAGKISALGREAVQMPLHPRIGRLLLRSKELGCPEVGCTLAALLSERDLFRHEPGGTPLQSKSDISERLDALNVWRESGRLDRRLDISAVKNVERVTRQLERSLSLSGSGKSVANDENLISRLLLAAYPDRIARRRSSGGGYLLASGRGTLISERSSVRTAEYIVALSLDAGNQAEAVVHRAVEINEQIIREERSKHIVCETQVQWDDREGRVIARRLELIGSIQLSTETVVPSASADMKARAMSTVITALRTSKLALLPMNESVRQLQNRLLLVRSSFPEHDWPDVSDAALCNSLEEWLAPHLDGVYTARKIAQLDIADILRQHLDYRRQRELDEIVPTHLSVPSGSRIRIDYSDDIPVLAVKLQELFGLAVGPTVCRGRVPVLLHLLSPAGRPIQVTQDLRGFWDGSYQQVKKELKGRYPKHPWPDDPWSAVPTRRLKPRGT
ncbi:MAG: ATP-dependent helicase HrpB [Desulfuromonadaceae bacterium]|nr:ATP-dependent helicase HrpB [Desulfuromonadaceae bacterium]